MTISRNLANIADNIDANGLMRSGLSNTVGGTGAKNWVYLGQCTLAANGFRTTTLSWATQFNQLMVEYYIAGYSGNAIGRILVGNVAPVGTETTCCTRLIENSVPVAGSTTSVSVSGWPTALTPDIGQRYGIMFITNQATKVKRMSGHGNWGGTAPTAVPTTVVHDGLYNNVTNSIQQICMANYLTAVATTVSTTITLTAGTFVNVWGRNDD